MSRETTPSTAATPRSQHTASTPATSYSKESTPSGSQSTASYLEQVCLNSVRTVNQRDVDISTGVLFQNASSTFKAHFDNFPHPLSMVEYCALLRQTIEQFPGFSVAVKSISSDVDEETGIASVYMETEVSGAPPEIKTISVNEYRWRRDRGVWKCWLHTGMKGISEYI